MTDKKINFGIRLDKRLVESLDEIVKESPDLNTTRSELIDAIIEAFFASKFDKTAKGREFVVIKRRKEKL